MTDKQKQIAKEKAKNEFMQLASTAFTNNFYSKNKLSLNLCIDNYKLLKDLYKPEYGKIVENYCFRHIFESFYAMARGIYVSNDFAEEFYQQMDSIRENGIGNKTPIDIAIKLYEKFPKDGLQFSFVTKMFNIQDDKTFPIYDSKVALIFGFSPYELSKKEIDKSKVYAERYELISNTYDELLKEEQILSVFKSIFKNAGKLEDKRLIDVLIWQLGKDKEKNLRKEAKNRKKVKQENS